MLTAQSLQHFREPQPFYFQGTIGLNAQARIMAYEDFWRSYGDAAVRSEPDRYHHPRSSVPLPEDVARLHFFVLTSSKLYELECASDGQRHVWMTEIEKAIDDMRAVNRITQG